MTDPINVPVPCTCPQAHEDGDVVYLAPQLGLKGGLAVEAAMGDDNPTLAVSLALISHNVLGWTKTDNRGDPVPVNDDNLEALLPWARGGEIVANRAAGLYLEDAFAPFSDTAGGVFAAITDQRADPSAPGLAQTLPPEAIQVLIAGRFGWGAVSDRPMTFPVAKWALLLIAEEGYGRNVRATQAQDDEQMRRARAALGG